MSESNAAESVAKKIDINYIQSLLPHRYPFLLIDRVISMELGQRISAYKNVTINEPFFQGHFPGHPVMPGVLIIEAIAQAAAILAFESVKAEDPTRKRVVYLAGIDEARFKKPVVPGDRLVLNVSMDRVVRSIGKFSCTAHVDDVLVAECKLIAALQVH